jgi:aconitate hydratase
MDAEVYLVSPETAGATALRGVLTDPRDLRRSPVRVRLPKKFAIDDSMIVPPPRTAKPGMELERGPNIVPPPENDALPASLNTEVLLKLGDGISTDDILPAGRWLKYRSNVMEYAKHTFAGISPGFAERARENQQRELASLIVAGTGYGQGSSREHAAMCPMALGVRVIIAKGFERIHLTNLVNHGIVPLTFLDQRTYEQINEDDYLELPWIARELRKSKTITVRNPDRGLEVRVSHSLTRRQIEIVLAGGLHNYVAGNSQI